MGVELGLETLDFERKRYEILKIALNAEAAIINEMMASG